MRLATAALALAVLAIAVSNAHYFADDRGTDLIPDTLFTLGPGVTGLILLFWSAAGRPPPLPRSNLGRGAVLIATLPLALATMALGFILFMGWALQGP